MFVVFVSFSDSKVVIYAETSVGASRLFSIIISRSEGISSLFGRPANYSGFQHQVQSSVAPTYFVSALTSFATSDAIGPGCDNVNSCSGEEVKVDR